MADFATALRAHLLSKSAITDVISTRLYAGVLPENPTYPAVTLLVTANDSVDHITGQSGLVFGILRVRAFSLDPLDNRKDAGIVEQIRLVLLDPDTEHTTVQGLWIESIRKISGPYEIVSPPRDASQRMRFIIESNYRVGYAEAVPT